LTALLSPALQEKQPIRHYDSIMSCRYLQQTYDAFRDPEGSCRLLFGTEAVSTVWP
jgi:hypothetical protein